MSPSHSRTLFPHQAEAAAKVQAKKDALDKKRQKAEREEKAKAEAAEQRRKAKEVRTNSFSSYSYHSLTHPCCSLHVVLIFIG